MAHAATFRLTSKRRIQAGPVDQHRAPESVARSTHSLNRTSGMPLQFGGRGGARWQCDRNQINARSVPKGRRLAGVADSMPDWVSPQLATLVSAPPTGTGWAYA